MHTATEAQSLVCGGCIGNYNKSTIRVRSRVRIKVKVWVKGNVA